MHIDITLDDRAVRAALNRLLQASADLTPAMRKLAGHLQDSAETTLASQTAPDGTPWKALTKVTQQQRKQAGYGAKQPILERSGDLFNSIVSDYGPDYALAGTNIPYATTHQFGARKGMLAVLSVIARKRKDGTVKRLKKPYTLPVPWGDIPARPFLGVSHEDKQTILTTLNDFIGRQWAGR